MESGNIAEWVTIGVTIVSSVGGFYLKARQDRKKSPAGKSGSVETSAMMSVKSENTLPQPHAISKVETPSAAPTPVVVEKEKLSPTGSIFSEEFCPVTARWIVATLHGSSSESTSQVWGLVVDIKDGPVEKLTIQVCNRDYVSKRCCFPGFLNPGQYFWPSPKDLSTFWPEPVDMAKVAKYKEVKYSSKHAVGTISFKRNGVLHTYGESLK